jgi:hypothetical protein
VSGWVEGACYTCYICYNRSLLAHFETIVADVAIAAAVSEALCTGFSPCHRD